MKKIWCDICNETILEESDERVTEKKFYNLEKPFRGFTSDVNTANLYSGKSTYLRKNIDVCAGCYSGLLDDLKKKMNPIKH